MARLRFMLKIRIEHGDPLRAGIPECPDLGLHSVGIELGAAQACPGLPVLTKRAPELTSALCLPTNERADRGSPVQMRRREQLQRVIRPSRKIMGSGDVKAGIAVPGRARRQGDRRRFAVAPNEVGRIRVERLELAASRVGDLRSAQHDLRSASQGTQQPLHLVLAPDERPNPDEGLGSGLVDGAEYLREEGIGTEPRAIDRIRDDADFDTRAAQCRRDRSGSQPETRISRSYPVHRHQHDGVLRAGRRGRES